MATSIYALCDPSDGRVRYIGKTVVKTNVRLSQHIAAAAKGRRNHLHCWIRSLSERPTIRTIERVSNERGFAVERETIAIYRNQGFDLVNESDGGEGQTGYAHTDATRAKLRAWNTGRKMPQKTPETLVRMADAQRGKKHTPEHRAKISAGGIGRTPTAETRVRLSAAKRGVRHTDEAKSKIRAAHLGRSLSAEHRAKIGAGGRGRKFSAEHRARLSAATAAYHATRPRRVPECGHPDRAHVAKGLCRQCYYGTGAERE